MEKVSASTAVECGSAVLEPSGIVHRRNNKGYEATHVTEEAELCEIVCDMTLPCDPSASPCALCVVLVEKNTQPTRARVARMRDAAGPIARRHARRTALESSHLANRQCSATFSCERHQGNPYGAKRSAWGNTPLHTEIVAYFPHTRRRPYIPGDRPRVLTPRTPGPVHPVRSYRFLLMRACGLLIVVAHGGIRPLRSARQSSLCSDRAPICALPPHSSSALFFSCVACVPRVRGERESEREREKARPGTLRETENVKQRCSLVPLKGSWRA